MLGVFVGVPIAFWDIRTALDRILDNAAFALASIVLGSLFFAAVYANKEGILAFVFNGAKGKISDITKHTGSFAQAVVDREAQAAIKSMEQIAFEVGAWYSWASLRIWVISSILGLLVAFTAVTGTILLHSQNQLIEKQGEFFASQVAINRAELSTKISKKLEDMIKESGGFYRKLSESGEIAILNDVDCVRSIVDVPNRSKISITVTCRETKSRMSRILRLIEEIELLLATKALDEKTVADNWVSTIARFCESEQFMDYIALYRSLDPENYIGVTRLET
ncbi:MAG: hypothetical protein GY875_13485 [Gammaproteobacteria bacterium]|nr:hypothetical protein [Gammaproteobacteria bacterium]